MKIDTQHPLWLAGEAGTRRELLRGAGLGIGAMAALLGADSVRAFIMVIP